MRKGLFRTSLSIIFIITLLVFGINYESFATETGVILEEDVITLYAGANATEEDKSYQFTLKVKGLAVSACTWSLSDDTYLTVNNEGLVSLKDNLPNNIDTTTVTLTVRNVSTNASDTALIFIEIDPLGSVIRTGAMFEEQFLGQTFKPVIDTSSIRTGAMFEEQFLGQTFKAVIDTSRIMTKEMFKEQYMEPTLDPIVVPARAKAILKGQFNTSQFLEQY